MADTEKPEGDVVEKHKYRICEIQPRERQFGRPRRNAIIAWDDLSDADLTTLRRLHEPRLGPNQIAELDGRTVARGSAVVQADIDDSETANAPAALRSDNPTEVTEFAHRMCWDIYERDMAASEELRKQAHLLNERAIEQSKQIDAMLAEIIGMRADLLRQAQAQQVQAPNRGITAQDIKEIVQAGAIIMHNMNGKAPGQPQ